MWNRLTSTHLTQNVSRPATGIKVVVQTGDLMISVRIRHFNWMPRLTTSRKLSTTNQFEDRWSSSFLFENSANTTSLLFAYCVSNFDPWSERAFLNSYSYAFHASWIFEKAQPMRFQVIPHRLFSLYIAVQILKNYYWERTCFFRESELQYSKLGRIFCFL